MSKNTVKVAVVGAGWWGTTAHIPALKKHPRAELVAVQARAADRARQIADDFGVPLACTTMDEVLAIDGLDAVIISTTPNMHHAQARAALEQGVHVLIEKPMTITAAEAADLVAVAERNHLHIVMSHPWHYSPQAAEARRLIASGALGRLKIISMLQTNKVEGLYRGQRLDKAFGIDSQQHPERLPYRMPSQTSYSDPAVAGGGQVYTQVSHSAAFLGYLTHAQPVEVFARFDNDGAEVDVYDSISIKLDNGALVTLSSHGLPMPGYSQFTTFVHGDAGALAVEMIRGELEYHDAGGKADLYPAFKGVPTYSVGAPAANLVDCILGQAENQSPGRLGWFAMQIIEAADQSARTGRNIVL